MLVTIREFWSIYQSNKDIELENGVITFHWRNTYKSCLSYGLKSYQNNIKIGLIYSAFY